MRALMSSAWALALAGVATGSAAPRMAIRDATDPAVTRRDGVVSSAGIPFTGVIVAWYAPGVRRSSTSYVSGRRDGDALAWYPNGRLTSDTPFRDGREDGVETAWWPDGRVHAVSRFRGGVLEGEAREWFPDGRLFRDFHYLHGHESGSERMWFADGRPRASYVIRDGRRYGLPGAAGCTGQPNEPAT